MLPPNFAESEAALFDDMSSGEDGEDWATLEEYRAIKRARKRYVATTLSKSNHLIALPLSENYCGRVDRFPSYICLLKQQRRSQVVLLALVLLRPLRPLGQTITAAHAHRPKLRIRSSAMLPLLSSSARGSTSHNGSSPNLSEHTKLRRPSTREALFGHRSLNATVSSSKNEKLHKGRKKAIGLSRSRSDTGNTKNYFQYALQLMARLPDVLQSSVLKDLVVFLASADMAPKPTTGETRKQLEYMVKHGATLAPIYDSATVTHIVTDLPKKADISKSLGVDCDNIPGNVRIVRWKWVTESINDGRLADQLKAERYPFRTLWPARKLLPLEEDRTIIEEHYDWDAVMDDKPPHRLPSTSNRASVESVEAWATSAVDQDPLAQFYARAAYGCDVDYDDYDSDEESFQPFQDSGTNSTLRSLKSKDKTTPPLLVRHNKGYACQDTGRPRETANEDIVSKLNELAKIHEINRNPDDHWKVLAYRKAIGSLRRCPKRIVSAQDIKMLPGIGERTAAKIAEIIETGELKRLRYEQTEENQTYKILTGIYNVGNKTAQAWYKRGIRTLDDVQAGKFGIKLTKAQQIGIRYYDDLQSRMTRDEAGSIFQQIKALALELDPKIWIEIMGSYRRGSPDCGDVDILISRPTEDGKTHRGLLARLLSNLTQKGIIIHTLGDPDDNLEAKFMGLCCVGPDGKARRIDILTVPVESWGASLIYFTGDDIFNRSMRLLANHKGMCLNHRGLWQDIMRDTKSRSKVTEGAIIASRTEEEIFEKLGVPWQLPHERIRAL